MINAITTCEFSQKYINQIKFLNIKKLGWSVSDIILSTDELIKEIDDENILIILYEQINEKVFISCPNIKMIISSRTGPSANIDIRAATKYNVPIFYIIGRNFNYVSELALGLMFSLARNIALSDRLLRQKKMTSNEEQEYKADVRWKTSRTDERYKLRGIEIKGKTMGIIGLGNIGSVMAEKCIKLEMNLVGSDPKAKPKNKNIELVSLDKLLKVSDFVSIHTKNTPGLISLKELKKMKNSAFLINVSRGAAVNEKDLIYALKNRIIAGAGLDVFDKEPISPNNELLSLDNVVLTPHLAGGGIAEDIINKSSELIVELLNNLRKKILPPGIANPELFKNNYFKKSFLDWYCNFTK